MKKDIKDSLLLDFYGNMLTEKQREIMNLYIECDTGQAEIASMLGTTRQAVYDIVKVSENLLLSYENKLKCVEKYLENREKLIENRDILQQYLQSNPNSKLQKVLENILYVLENQ